jgi:hypothetical protein
MSPAPAPGPSCCIAALASSSSAFSSTRLLILVALVPDPRDEDDAPMRADARVRARSGACGRRRRRCLAGGRQGEEEGKKEKNGGAHVWRGWRASGNGGWEGEFGGASKMEDCLEVLLELCFCTKPLKFGVEVHMKAPIGVALRLRPTREGKKERHAGALPRHSSSVRKAK